MDPMAESDSGPGISSFVAIGDSFTEGLHDPDPAGGYLGWADRVAGTLSERRSGFRYANLAIRGSCWTRSWPSSCRGRWRWHRTW